MNTLKKTSLERFSSWLAIGYLHQNVRSPYTGHEFLSMMRLFLWLTSWCHQWTMTSETHLECWIYTCFMSSVEFLILSAYPFDWFPLLIAFSWYKHGFRTWPLVWCWGNICFFCKDSRSYGSKVQIYLYFFTQVLEAQLVKSSVCCAQNTGL